MKQQINFLSFLKCLFIITFFTACQGGNAETEAPQDSSYYKGVSEEEYFAEKTTEEGGESETQNAPSSEPLEIKPMLIKNVDLSIETKDIKKWRGDLDEKLKKYEAYIVSENQYSNTYEIQDNITIRVPSDKFDDFIKILEDGEGEISNKTIRVQDVTAEYLDLAGRLKTRQEVLERYRALISKANVVKDIIEIEEAARQVQEEIEAAQGRMKYLKNQSSFSTINLNVEQTLQHRRSLGFGGKLVDALVSGWQGFLMFLIGIAHLWVLILFGVFAFIFIRRRFFKKDKS